MDVLYELVGHAAVLTLNRPERLNTWGPAIDTALQEAVARARQDVGARAIIITGAGKAFCAGADLSRTPEYADARARQAEQAPMQHREVVGIERNYRRRFSKLLAVGKPIIAAVNGPASGVGFAITLYCDMRFAGESARFSTAFARVGLSAEVGMPWLLPRLVGMGAALDLLCSGRVIDAREALAMRVVERVFPDDQLLPATIDYVNKTLVRASPSAVAATKKLAWDAQFQDLADAFAADHEATLERRVHPDFKEGVRAFMEKRPPVWAPFSA